MVVLWFPASSAKMSDLLEFGPTPPNSGYSGSGRAPDRSASRSVGRAGYSPFAAPTAAPPWPEPLQQAGRGHTPPANAFADYPVVRSARVTATEFCVLPRVMVSWSVSP